MPSRKPKIEADASYLQAVEEIDKRFELIKRRVYEVTKGRVSDYDPVVEMALIANDPSFKDELRFAAHNKVAEFVYPKARSLDFNTGTQNEVKIAIHIAPYAQGGIGDKSKVIEVAGKSVDA